jgi:hypothetical protein
LYPWKDVFAPLYYTISPIKTEREGIISNKKKLKVLCREGRFVSMEGHFCTSLLHNFTNKDEEGGNYF